MKKNILLLWVISSISFTYGDNLSVTVTTRTYGGKFAPKHSLAIWINDAQDKFVKTLEECGRLPDYYGNTLVKWISYSNKNTTDAITSASLLEHKTEHATWNCKDFNNADVPNGVYKIYVEFAEDNAGLLDGVALGPWIVYEFTKGPNSQNKTFPDSNYFAGAQLNFVSSGPADTIAPSIPTNVVSSNISATSCTISWIASTDNLVVAGYEVFDGSRSLGTSTTNSIALTNLVCSTTYSLTVKAFDDARNVSPASAPLPITTSACVPGAENVINDNNVRITYSGAWESGSYDTDPGNINKDEHLTNATDASASLTFTGSSISWIGASSANRGIVDVYIDNVKVSSVDAYSSALSFQKVLYTNTSLSSGSHTIKLVNTGTKNASSSGAYLIVDAFKYTNPGATPTIGSRHLKGFQQQFAFVTAQGMITINLSSAGFTRVRIADSNGRLVYSTIAVGKLIMPSSAIKPGVYFVSEQCDGLTRGHKVALSQ